VILIVVSYDVSTVTPEGKRRLRKVAKLCENFGQRVQNSVFECWVDPTSLVTIKAGLLNILEPDTDSLRLYFLGEQWRGRVEHYGAKSVHDPDGPLIL
jgi:CRISPR-associated protein Cas2